MLECHDRRRRAQEWGPSTDEPGTQDQNTVCIGVNRML